MPTTDYYFTNIQPDPITIPPPPPRGNNSDLTAQHTATKDQIPQQMHPLRPGETRVYPSMLADKQVPVLDLTNSTITSQADLQTAFQSLHLCEEDDLSHGRKQPKEKKYPLIIFLTVNLQRKKQISIYVHPKRKDYIIQLKDLHKPHKQH